MILTTDYKTSASFGSAVAAARSPDRVGKQQPHPLGLYVFAEGDDVIDQILSLTESGDPNPTDPDAP